MAAARGARAVGGGRLNPAGWPVRWRITLASAGLTMAILLVFGGVIGHLASNRIEGDFNRELRAAVTTLADEVAVIETPSGPIVQGPLLDDFVLPTGASARVLGPQGQLLDYSRGAADLGPPVPGITDLGSMRVATARVVNGGTGQVAGYVQYGRDEEYMSSTIERLWLFIVAGILGGTLLATLAGLAIAERAMRPVASLTARAREVADTRDPSRHMPAPAATDEVGELAVTLEAMLRSLDGARSERESALAKQREFVADASHELRTPLTSILANLELLEASLAEAGHEDEREMVASALRSSRRMRRLVADLLILARADAGRLGEHLPCDLAAIADDVIAEVGPTSAGHEIELSASPARVSGNPDELHRMLLNLVDNAVKHTPPGTRIEIRVRPESEQGRAVVEVADDGPGIAADQRDRIFARFVRGEGPGDTAAGPGLGLGLAIVRAVAGAHSGDVSAGRSDLGGASFVVRLPLAGAEVEAEARSLAPL